MEPCPPPHSPPRGTSPLLYCSRRPDGDSTATRQRIACVTCSLLAAASCILMGDQTPGGGTTERKVEGGWPREAGCQGPGHTEPPPDGPQGPGTRGQAHSSAPTHFRGSEAPGGLGDPEVAQQGVLLILESAKAGLRPLGGQGCGVKELGWLSLPPTGWCGDPGGPAVAGPEAEARGCPGHSLNPHPLAEGEKETEKWEAEGDERPTF